MTPLLTLALPAAQRLAAWLDLPWLRDHETRGSDRRRWIVMEVVPPSTMPVYGSHSQG
jgi:hypothetical protein